MGEQESGSSFQSGLFIVMNDEVHGVGRTSDRGPLGRHPETSPSPIGSESTDGGSVSATLHLEGSKKVGRTEKLDVFRFKKFHPRVSTEGLSLLTPVLTRQLVERDEVGLTECKIPKCTLT